VSAVAQEIGSDSEALRAALAAVVTVGLGRGFVVEGRGLWDRPARYIITAAHCLPERPDGQKLPPPHGGSYTEERIYANLLAPLGEQPSVWCECLFVDPIADIAVLGAPDNQELSDEADAYEALVDAATPLAVAEPPSKPIAEEVAPLVEAEKQWAWRECPAFLLSLSNEWFPCKVQHAPGGTLLISDTKEGIAGGMSGSPIIAEDGGAIGIVCLGSGSPGDDEGGPNPRLMGNLPGWFLKERAAKPMPTEKTKRPHYLFTRRAD
jgi:hypothetical protein